MVSYNELCVLRHNCPCDQCGLRLAVEGLEEVLGLSHFVLTAHVMGDVAPRAARGVGGHQQVHPLFVPGGSSLIVDQVSQQEGSIFTRL